MNDSLIKTGHVLGLLVLLLQLGVAQAAGTLSERTYKRITAIHELMGEDNYGEALKRLDLLLPKVKRKPYEYATVMQTYGYVYAATSKYLKAVEAFAKALDTEALPDGVQLSMMYNMSQLYAAIPKYNKSAEFYEQWFARTENPSVESYVFAATLYAQLNKYQKAIGKITKAISMVEKPKEPWYQLLLALYYQQKAFAKAAQTLETMVALFPDNPKYWKQLSGVYFTLKQNRKSLAILELAHKRGFLETEKDRMNLVNMYLFEQIPYKAAVILEQEIKAGHISATGKNLEKLGEAWMTAKETGRAIDYLGRAADEKQDARLYLRIAQLYAEQEKWPEVLSAISKVESIGGLKKPGKALLVKGMALFEQGELNSALRVFQQGLKYPESRKPASQWIAHINNEKQIRQ